MAQELNRTSVSDVDITLASVPTSWTSSLPLSSCGENADGLGGWDDRTKEGRDRRCPGAIWRVS